MAISPTMPQCNTITILMYINISIKHVSLNYIHKLVQLRYVLIIVGLKLEAICVASSYSCSKCSLIISAVSIRQIDFIRILYAQFTRLALPLGNTKSLSTGISIPVYSLTYINDYNIGIVHFSIIDLVMYSKYKSFGIPVKNYSVPLRFTQFRLKLAVLQAVYWPNQQS